MKDRDLFYVEPDGSLMELHFVNGVHVEEAGSEGHRPHEIVIASDESQMVAFWVYSGDGDYDRELAEIFSRPKSVNAYYDNREAAEVVAGIAWDAFHAGKEVQREDVVRRLFH